MSGQLNEKWGNDFMFDSANTNNRHRRIMNLLFIIVTIISVWVAYKQFQLQAVQTTMQAEQVALSKEHVRIQALQALPVLTVKRKTVNTNEGTSKLEVCGAESELRMVSGFKAL